MEQSIVELRAGVFVKQLLLGAEQVKAFSAQSTLVSYDKDSTEEQKQAGCEQGQLAMMMEKGVSVELARLMSLWYTDLEAAKTRGGCRLSTLDDYLDEVVIQLDGKVEDMDFESMSFADDHGDPYFGIIIEALRMFARSEALTLSIFIYHSDAGTMDKVWWHARIWLTEPDGTFLTVPFFATDNLFETREGGADAIAEAYGLEPQYDDDTQEMLDDVSRAGRLEAEMLDITDEEKVETLLKDLTWLDFIEDKEPNETNTEALLAFIEDRAERIVAHYSAPETQGAVSIDGAGAVLEAAQGWQVYSDGQKELLLEVYEETHQ